MNGVTVRTSEELKKAIKEKQDEIIVIGKLAKEVKSAEKIKKLSPIALSIIGALDTAVIAGIFLVPVTGGQSLALSFVAAPAAAAATGLSIPAILLLAVVGLGLISTLFDEYTHIEIGIGKFVFIRKNSTKDVSVLKNNM